MPASTLGAQIEYMAVGWHTRSNKTYMSANTHVACIYYMAVSWHACTDKTYMSADTLGAQMIYLGQYTISGSKIYLG